MIHEPKPSEHAIAAASAIVFADDFCSHARAAAIIQAKAIAPAVAQLKWELDATRGRLNGLLDQVNERDRRIAELEALLIRWDQWAACFETPGAGQIFNDTRAVFAKSERSAP